MGIGGCVGIVAILAIRAKTTHDFADKDESFTHQDFFR